MSVSTLHTVNLANCDFLRDDGISHLVRKSSHLQVLNISKCRCLTGKSLQAVAQVRISDYKSGSSVCVVVTIAMVTTDLLPHQ